jgi:hypothetical protein
MIVSVAISISPYEDANKLGSARSQPIFNILMIFQQWPETSHLRNAKEPPAFD